MTVDETVKSESAEKSPTHCTTAEGELRQEDLIDFYSYIHRYQLLSSLSEISACPVITKKAIYELYVCPETTMEAVPLSETIPVMGVALLLAGLRMLGIHLGTVCLSRPDQGGSSPIRCALCAGSCALCVCAS